jgi:hypothetical protein
MPVSFYPGVNPKLSEVIGNERMYSYLQLLLMLELS